MSTIIIGCQCVNGALSGPFCAITGDVIGGFSWPVAVVLPGGRSLVFEFVYLCFLPAFVKHFRGCHDAFEVGGVDSTATPPPPKQKHTPLAKRGGRHFDDKQ